MFDVEMQKVTVREMIDRFNDWGDDHVFLFHSSNVSGDDLCLVVQIDPYDDSMDAPVEVDGERWNNRNNMDGHVWIRKKKMCMEADGERKEREREDTVCGTLVI